MMLFLNGGRREFPGTPGMPRNLTWLVSELGLRPEVVAIEVNGELVPRTVFAEFALSDGDRVECVTLVGGG